MTELTIDGGVRMFVPLLGGTERVGVLAFTAHDPSADDRRLARRFAGLVADVMVAKGGYTDRFFQARRQYPVSLSAELQWSLLPPLMMNCPQVSVAGHPRAGVRRGGRQLRLRPERRCPAGRDHRRDGHGLDAAVMASVAVAAYRHARRADHDLLALYAAMNHAILEQFDVGPLRHGAAGVSRRHHRPAQLAQRRTPATAAGARRPFHACAAEPDGAADRHR
jgi:hypothetical protein